MNSTVIRIALVDDHQLVRESWKMLLESDPRFKVVAESGNGEEALEKIALTNPDIMLVDINMSPLNGFEVAEKMTALYPFVKLIGLSVSNQPRYAARILELGARGYLTKTSSLAEIIQGILKVHAGEQYICEEMRVLLGMTTK